MMSTEEQIIRLLRKHPMTERELLAELGVKSKELKSVLSGMSGMVNVNGQHLSFNKGGVISDGVVKNPDMGKDVVFGVVSDTHLGSTSDRLDLMERMYDLFDSEGIKTVYHAGDLTDGFTVYAGHENHVKTWGVDNQAVYAIQKYPFRKNIRTRFITGNHDLKAMKKGGVDIGNQIVGGVRLVDPIKGDVESVVGRDDLEYLGQYYRRVMFANDISLDLLHPDSGYAYAQSYFAQRYVNNLDGGDKPNVLIYGHLHQNIYLQYRNVQVLAGGTFQDQNEFSRRKGFPNTKGGWIVRMKIADHGIERFIPEWIPQFDKAPNVRKRK